jgi:hypothetical protein
MADVGQTKPGRQLIAAHRAELNEVEKLVNAHVAAWRDGDPTPVGPALEAMLARWRALPTGEELVVEWPTRRLPSAEPRVRERRPSGLRSGPSDPELA